MTENQFTMQGRVWLYPGMAGWHFVTLPQKESNDIKKHLGKMAKGWGSLPVTVTILRPRSGRVGKTSWKTSIFPDKKSETYLLPLKSEVRKKEKIIDGDIITFSLIPNL